MEKGIQTYINKINESLLTEDAKEFFKAIENNSFNELSAKMFYIQIKTRIRRTDKLMCIIENTDWQLINN